MNAKEIGRRLTELRGEKTRREVSEESGISYSAMSNFECGLRVPSDSCKVALAKYYGVSVEELFYADCNHNR